MTVFKLVRKLRRIETHHQQHKMPLDSVRMNKKIIYTTRSLKENEKLRNMCVLASGLGF